MCREDGGRRLLQALMNRLDIFVLRGQGPPCFTQQPVKHQASAHADLAMNAKRQFELPVSPPSANTC